MRFVVTKSTTALKILKPSCGIVTTEDSVSPSGSEGALLFRDFLEGIVTLPSAADFDVFEDP
jgi:hypothetical protein